MWSHKHLPIKREDLNSEPKQRCGEGFKRWVERGNETKKGNEEKKLCDCLALQVLRQESGEKYLAPEKQPRTAFDEQPCRLHSGHLERGICGCEGLGRFETRRRGKEPTTGMIFLSNSSRRRVHNEPIHVNEM